MIVVVGSGGGLSELSSALFASHGFATLALAYFGIEPLPPELVEIPLESFEAALDWLAAQPGVDGECLGVVGTSRGGELALLLGATFPRLRAVVGYVPSSVLHQGVRRGVPTPGRLSPSWTWREAPRPYLQQRLRRGLDRFELGPEPIALTPLFLFALDHSEVLDEATIPVERIQGGVMLVSGEEDAMWP